VINFLIKFVGYICWGFYTLWIIIKVLFFVSLFGLYIFGCDKLSQFLAYEISGNSMGLWHLLILIFLIFVPIYLYWKYNEKVLSNED